MSSLVGACAYITVGSGSCKGLSFSSLTPHTHTQEELYKKASFMIKMLWFECPVPLDSSTSCLGLALHPVQDSVNT